MGAMAKAVGRTRALGTKSRKAAVLAFVLGQAGCSDVTDVRDEARQATHLGTLYAAIEVNDASSSVSGVRFDVLPLGFECSETPTVSEVLEVGDATGPRDFANALFVLEVGAYRVCATPLDEDGPSGVCSRADGEVEIVDGVTTELELVSQCENAAHGGLDVVVSLNDAPAITRVELTPAAMLSVCESLTAVATAVDPNDDPLTYTWSISDGPSGAILEVDEDTVQFSGPVGDYDLTLEVSDGHGGTDSLEFPISVTNATCEGEIDTTPPVPATGLQASIESRRETSVRVTWTHSGEDVAGYDVAYLGLAASDMTTVIDDSNFDAATQVPDVSGSALSAVIHDLTIEKRYLFAIRPYDAAGNVGPISATATPIRAQFQTLVLTPPAVAAPGTQWGFSVDASTDLDGDGTADLVVGQKYGDRVHIYLGQPGGTYSNSPSAVIIGPAESSFGASVAVVGNVIGGGYEDIAIAAPTDGPVLGRVYVISGRAWNGDSVDVSDGTNPSGSIIDFPTTSPYPAHVARLGDFDGDGDADFAIHALGYGQAGACDPDTLENCEGALLVIKGASNPSNFPATVTVPDDVDAVETYFPSTLGFYGSDWLLGVTDFVGARSAVLAAEYQAGVQRLITRNEDALGGFDEQVLDYGPPQFSADTLVYDTEIGSYPAALLGESTLALQLTNARDGLGTTPGVVDLYSLSPTGTFGAPVTTLKAGGETNNFGQVLVGNRHSGRPSSYNLPFFGRDGEAPALVVGGRYYASRLPKLFMLSAPTIANFALDSAGHELTGVADVEYLLSSVPGVDPNWTDALGVPSDDADWHGGIGFAVHDMNADGFADVGITEWEFEAAYTGGIIILY